MEDDSISSAGSPRPVLGKIMNALGKPRPSLPKAADMIIDSTSLDFASIYQVTEWLCPTLVFCEIVPIPQNPTAELIVPGQLPDGRVFLTPVESLKKDCSVWFQLIRG